jgi:hypothetical protein
MIVIKQNESINRIVNDIADELYAMSKSTIEEALKQDEKPNIEKNIERFQKEFVPMLANAMQEVGAIQAEIKKLQKQKKEIESMVKDAYHTHVTIGTYYGSPPTLKTMEKNGMRLISNIKVSRAHIEKANKIGNYFKGIKRSVESVVTTDKEESIANIIEVLKAYNIDFEYVKEEENNQLAKEMLSRIFNS